MERVASGTVKELIMGTNPTMEGDGTALHITEEIKLKYPEVAVTKLARGLPAGGSIEYANRAILSDALSGRRQW
jgi:recombination protein RecR